MINQIHYFFLLFTIFFFFIKIQTSTYYISPNGVSSWSNCQTISTPCSLSTANEYSQPNDIIFLLSGSYITEGIAPLNNGNENEYITYKKYNDNNDVLITGSTIIHGIDVIGKSYIYIEGVRVAYLKKNNNKWFNIIDSDHIHIKNCVFDEPDTFAMDGWGNSDLRGSEYVTLEGVYMDASNCLYKIDDYIGTSKEGTGRQWDNLIIDSSSHILIKDSYIGDASHTGITINSGEYIVFQGNIFSNRWRRGYELRPKSISNKLNYLLFENNTVKYVGRESRFCPWFGDRDRTCNNKFQGNYFIVRYNKFYGNDVSFGIRCDEQDPAYMHVYHNTFYNSSVPEGHELNPIQGGIFVYSECAEKQLHDVHLFNNIFYKSKGRPVYIMKYGTNPNSPYDNYVHHNSWTDTPEQYRYVYYYDDMNALETAKPDEFFDNYLDITDPLFVDDTKFPDPNLFLKKNSPCRNLGVELSKTKNSGENSKILIVENALRFFSGKKMPWLIPNTEPDTVIIEDSGKSKIDYIDYTTNTLYLESSLTWDIDKKIYIKEFRGTGPDLGMYEYGVDIDTGGNDDDGNPNYLRVVIPVVVGLSTSIFVLALLICVVVAYCMVIRKKNHGGGSEKLIDITSTDEIGGSKSELQ